MNNIKYKRVHLIVHLRVFNIQNLSSVTSYAITHSGVTLNTQNLFCVCVSPHETTMCEHVPFFVKTGPYVFRLGSYRFEHYLALKYDWFQDTTFWQAHHFLLYVCLSSDIIPLSTQASSSTMIMTRWKKILLRPCQCMLEVMRMYLRGRQASYLTRCCKLISSRFVRDCKTTILSFLRINKYLAQLETLLSTAHHDLIDAYSATFPDSADLVLDSHRNEMDVTRVDLPSILTPNQIITIYVASSTTMVPLTVLGHGRSYRLRRAHFWVRGT